MLEVTSLRAGYGGAPAVDKISLAVPAGTVVALLGANGAGKTTTMLALSGLLRYASGEVRLGGERIDGCSPHRIVAKGLAQVPQGRQVFPHMTVRENLEVGATTRPRHDRNSDALNRVFEIFPKLAERAAQMSGTLSGGEQQMLAIGRALMSQPRILLMDEPSLGLAPIIVRRLYESIARLTEHGLGILLAEQNINMALDFTQHAYVLVNGRIGLAGESSTLRYDPALKRAYLSSL